MTTEKNQNTELPALEDKAALQAADQEEKKTVVIGAIQSQCVETSEHAVLRDIALVLKDKPHCLTAIIIAGGKTNYSYKVFVQEQPELAVYAKICFNYALWNPNRSVIYDTQRTVNEFNIMKSFAKLMQQSHEDSSDNNPQEQPQEKVPLAQPYFVADVLDGTAKVLATEWSVTDQQWGTQFQDGRVDERIVRKVARALGKLNLQTPDDPNWGDVVRPSTRTMYQLAKAEFAKLLLLNDNDNSDTLQLCHQLGQDAFDRIADNGEEEYMMVRDVLCHNDSHQFNMLVRPNNPDTGAFAAEDDFCIVDWEQCIAGPCGKDAGLFQLFPVAFAMCHAVQGKKQKASHMMDISRLFWDSYLDILVQEGGKDEAYLHQTLLHALGIMGFYQFVGIYQLMVNKDLLPFDEGASETLVSKAMDAIGAVSLTLLDVAHGEHPAQKLPFPELMKFYEDLVQSYMDKMLAVGVSAGVGQDAPGYRRSHSSTRRVSDASVLDEAIFRRLSQQE